MKVGILALQGAVREHAEVLDALGVEAIEVRAPAELAPIDALILPGGESTTIGRLLGTSELLGRAHVDRLDAERVEHLTMLAERPLQGQHAHLHDLEASRSLPAPVGELHLEAS